MILDPRFAGNSLVYIVDQIVLYGLCRVAYWLVMAEVGGVYRFGLLVPYASQCTFDCWVISEERTPCWKCCWSPSVGAHARAAPQNSALRFAISHPAWPSHEVICAINCSFLHVCSIGLSCISNYNFVSWNFGDKRLYYSAERKTRNFLV